MLEKHSMPGRTGSAAAPTLDPEPLAAIRRLGLKTGEDLVGQMLEIYRGETPQRIDTMRRALTDRDTATLAKAAHSLAGSAVYLGAYAMAELCRELEELADQADLEGCETRLRAVEEEQERVLHRLRSL